MPLTLRSVVLDAEDARALAAFYGELLGWDTLLGSDEDWSVITHPETGQRVAFQRVDALARATWPEGPVPQQLHLDLSVSSAEELDTEHARVLTLGGTLLQDRADDPEERLRVYADPAGHPFCVFVV